MMRARSSFSSLHLSVVLANSVVEPARFGHNWFMIFCACTVGLSGKPSISVTCRFSLSTTVKPGMPSSTSGLGSPYLRSRNKSPRSRSSWIVVSSSFGEPNKNAYTIRLTIYYGLIYRRKNKELLTWLLICWYIVCIKVWRWRWAMSQAHAAETSQVLVEASLAVLSQYTLQNNWQINHADIFTYRSSLQCLYWPRHPDSPWRRGAHLLWKEKIARRNPLSAHQHFV